MLDDIGPDREWYVLQTVTYCFSPNLQQLQGDFAVFLRLRPETHDRRAERQELRTPCRWGAAGAAEEYTKSVLDQEIWASCYTE